MRHRIFYNPFQFIFTLILGLILAFSVTILFFGLASTAFARIGFSWSDAFLLLFISLVGSNVNIPLTTIESEIPMENQKYVKVFGVSYRVPFKQTFRTKTTVAVNMGGAIIPTMVSLYLLSIFPEAFTYCVSAILFVTVVTKLVARPVKGVGIVSPALIPPLAAALGSTILISAAQADPNLLFVTAYISGTMGTLIGADLLNLKAITKIGAPVVSIGGAGTFDGVFLSGVIAVLLV
ncbi:DUF1614 domain-containing protein [Methanolobus sp. ZRKC3]|uniref:DUF1614 domain-containing protein n=1 Tax=Methanolobus sp. ZRKC3 TaxID=3125786 RepID=UPI0032443CB2